VGDAGALGGGGDAEVRELDDPAGVVDQHVRGLHVPVDDTRRVGVVERRGDRLQHLECPVGIHPAARDLVAQRVARDVLHDDQDALVVGDRVVDADDVRVVQRRADLGLALEAPADVLRAVGVQALDRDIALQAAVLCEENGGHSACSQAPLHAVAAGHHLACHPDGHGTVVPRAPEGANDPTGRVSA
jgi:hypothetical protein